MREGEAFDPRLLASDAIAASPRAVSVLPASLQSPVPQVAVAVIRPARRRPDISTGAGVQSQAVLQAATIGYCTGPSGTSLAGAVRALGNPPRCTAETGLAGGPWPAYRLASGSTRRRPFNSAMRMVDVPPVLG